MAEAFPGHWQPWEPDGSGRHKCGSGVVKTPASLPRKSYPETSSSPCPWCKKPVYYHTNGYGDSVYFDALGVPWQVHPCWEQYWKTQIMGKKAIGQQKKALQQEERKHRKLLVALRKAASSQSKHNNCTYAATLELKIAQVLHLNLRQLRQEYGHLYVLEPNGIRFLGLLNIFQQSSEEVTEASEAPASSQVAEGKDTSKPEMVSCPCCSTEIRKDRLKRHLQKAHRVGIPTASISPEICLLRAQVRCSYCPKILSDQFLKNHIRLCHPEIGLKPLGPSA
jgi:hypothetical protein